MATKTKKPAEAAAEATYAETMQSVFPGPAGFPSYGDLADLSRENIAAVIKSNAALTQGLEAISKEVMGYARTSFESATQITSALLGAKSFEDLVQLNSQFAKASLETLVARSAKLQEMGVKVANEALAPIGSRVEATLSKLTKPLAA